jgi:hypothetical protein
MQAHQGELDEGLDEPQDEEQSREDLDQVDDDVSYEDDEYAGDENVEGLQMFADDAGNDVASMSVAEVVEVGLPVDDALEAAEEDELYEENDEEAEEYDPSLQSPESLVNEMDDGDADEQHIRTTELSYTSTQRGIALYHWFLNRSESEESQIDEDDLISYEEAVDQTEDGQDYRQQYIGETSVAPAPANGRPLDKGFVAVDDKIGDRSIDTGQVVPVAPRSPDSKRSLAEVTSAEDQEPRISSPSLISIL